jgi:hypothetical protein
MDSGAPRDLALLLDEREGNREMTDAEKVKLYEAVFPQLWGHVLGVTLQFPDNEKVRQSFNECDRLVRAADLI